MAELGPRLRAIAERVIPGEPMADVCCDHARLATALVVDGVVPRAIAVDVNAGPLRQAAEVVAAAGVTHRVEMRRGDGLMVLRPEDAVATVTIAGVGSALVERVLRASPVEPRRVVIQANDVFPRLGGLRRALFGLGWHLTDERLAEARGRFYTVLVAERDGAADRDGVARLDDVDVDLGPILRRGDDPLFGRWLAHERDRVERALTGMRRGARDTPERARFERWAQVLAVVSDRS